MQADETETETDADTGKSGSKTIEWSKDAEASEKILAAPPNAFIVINNEIFTRHACHLYRRSR